MIAWYIEYEYWVAAVQLVLAMLGMGAGLQVTDFKLSNKSVVEFFGKHI